MIEVPDFVSGMQEVSLKEYGANVVFATDDFFAVAENLLKTEEPHRNDEYTEFGKWMDGWETRRRHIPGHDWTILALIGLSNLTGICVDTTFFTGNYAPHFSLQAAYLPKDVSGIQIRKRKMGTGATKDDWKRVDKLHSENWETLIPMTATLKSGNNETRKNYFKLNTGQRVFTHLRLNLFPDGGIARLRVYGQSAESTIRKSGSLKPIGGKCVQSSNAHYGNPDSLLYPWPPKGMYDGWETARRLDRPPTIQLDDDGFLRQKGEEWAILKLEKSIYVKNIAVDTTYFKGNCPDSVIIDGAFVKPSQDLKTVSWETIVNKTKLIPDQNNGLENPQIKVLKRPINHVKVTIAPDGGLSRIRIYGTDA